MSGADGTVDGVVEALSLGRPRATDATLLDGRLEVSTEKGRAAHSVVEWITNTVAEPDAKAPPGRSGRGLLPVPAQSPFCLRLRDQMRVKVSPSSSTRLA